MKHKTILLIDDDEGFCKAQEHLFAKKGYQLVWTTKADDIAGLLSKHSPSCILLDLKLGRADGLQILAEIRESDDRLPVIMLTGYESIKSAVESMKKGAFHYMTKSIDSEELFIYLDKAIQQRTLYLQIEEMRARLGEFDNLEGAMGNSEAIQKVIRLVRSVATTDVNVLLIGESGAGKELVARAIHHQSARQKGPFVAVDCASIPETLIESELFGHEKGAFTGAIATVKGKFESANDGTLLLDEIANIPMTVQAKLLRFLESHEFQRVGGRENHQASVRIIAASNRHPEDLVKKEIFRQDLFYRLNEFPIHLPPLRERREDIPLLCRRFLDELDLEVGRGISEISHDALARLQAYDFPGNVRELKNIIKRAMVVANRRIEIKDLPFELPSRKHHGEEASEQNLRQATHQTTLRVERQMIIDALKKTGGHHGKAAELLGITSRTLYNKLKELGIQA